MKLQGLLGLLFVLVLAGCAGGSSEPGSAFPGQTVSKTYSVDVALLDGAGSDVSQLAYAEDYTALATIIETVTTTVESFALGFLHPAPGART